MANDVKELLEMKRKIEQAKSEVSKIDGQVEQLTPQLKEFGVSVDKAQYYLKKLSGEINAQQEELTKRMSLLREKLNNA